VRRPASFNPKREPGPFTLNYYANGRGGLKTFAGAPVAVYSEDFVAGKVDVAIVGAPLDMGSHCPGQRFGPMAMRNEYGAGGIGMNTMVNPSKELNIVDYGDIAIDNMSTERTGQAVAGDAFPQGLDFSRYGRSMLRGIFSQPFVDALWSAPLGQWNGPIESPRGGDPASGRPASG
jgi:hypothetical protein